MTALALLTVLSAVGVSAVRAAMDGLARSLDEARWNATVILFDRTLRGAIDELPSAFWAPPPRVLREGGELQVVDGSEAMRFSLQGRLLSVVTRTTTVLFRGITDVSVETVTSSDGRDGGIRVELVSGRRRQDFLIAWKGQRL